MLTINKESGYGLIMIYHLMEEKGFISLSSLVKKTKLPRRFLAKIASDLVRSGILESHEGRWGGYRVLEKHSRINLYDYLKIFEGELRIVDCVDGRFCPFQDVCFHDDYFKNKINMIIKKDLKRIKIINLFKR